MACGELTAYHKTIPQSITNDVNNAVSVLRFFAPSPTALQRNDSLPLYPRSTYRMNDTLYLRADFAGLAIASARVNALASAYGTGPMVDRYTVDSADIYPSPPAVCGMKGCIHSTHRDGVASYLRPSRHDKKDSSSVIISGFAMSTNVPKLLKHKISVPAIGGVLF
jgi:hypothetical protein